MQKIFGRFVGIFPYKERSSKLLPMSKQ